MDFLHLEIHVICHPTDSYCEVLSYTIFTWYLHDGYMIFLPDFNFSSWALLELHGTAGLASLPGVWIGCCQWCEKCSLRLKVSPSRCHAGRAIARAGRGFSPFQKLPIFDFQSFISWLRFSQDFFFGCSWCSQHLTISCSEDSHESVVM